MRLGWLAAAALPLFGGGCMVGPDYKSPPTPVAAKFLEANQPSVDTKRQEYEAWWRVFHDPVLDRLIQIAYNQNLSLVAAGTRVLQARAELGVAIGEFYPQTQHGTGSLLYNRESHADPTATPQSELANFWRNSLGLTVNWELDFWGKFRRAIQSAELRLSRIDRRLRRRARHADWRCRDDLYRHTHTADTDRDREREHR